MRCVRVRAVVCLVSGVFVCWLGSLEVRAGLYDGNYLVPIDMHHLQCGMSLGSSQWAGLLYVYM